MRIASTSRLVQDIRADREAKLKAFIVADHTGALTLVARNPESPVAQALRTAIAENADLVATTRVIFFETTCDDAAAASLLDVANLDVRTLSDARFGAAHEQMVLTANRVWIGDCMRRDPSKRDAFEIYHSDNTAACQHAAASFAKLWAAAAPVKRATAPAVAAELVAAQSAEAPLAAISPRS